MIQKITVCWSIWLFSVGFWLGPVGCEGLSRSAVQQVTPSLVLPTSTSVPTSSVPVQEANIIIDTNVTVISSPVPTAIFNCDNANFPVCDGFETVVSGALPDPNRWNSAVGPAPDDGTLSDHPTQNTIEVTQRIFHRGTQSLHIHTVEGTEHLVIQDVTSSVFPQTFLPAPNNLFYVRLWIYDDGFGGDLSQIPPGSSHLYIVNASGPLDGRQQYEKFGAGDGPSGPATLNWNYYGNDAIVTDANFKWVLGAWTCFETEFNGTTGELKVWQNDTLVSGLHVTAGIWQAPEFNRLVIGWEMDHPPSTFAGTDVYIDDVAYSYQRIGCAP